MEISQENLYMDISGLKGLIDLSCILMSSGTELRSGWRKIQEMYKNVQLTEVDIFIHFL